MDFEILYKIQFYILPFSLFPNYFWKFIYIWFLLSQFQFSSHVTTTVGTIIGDCDRLPSVIRRKDFLLHPSGRRTKHAKNNIL